MERLGEDTMKNPRKPLPPSLAQFEEGDRKLVTEAKNAGGGKLSRSEVVTVRLDPKLGCLADIVARKQRRTLSSFIEWAIEESLAREKLKGSSTAMESSLALWDVDECDRFVKLALFDEGLLSYRNRSFGSSSKIKEILEYAQGAEEDDWKRLREIWGQAVGSAKAAGTDVARMWMK